MTQREYFREPVLVIPQNSFQTEGQKDVMAKVRKKYLDLRMMSVFLKLGKHKGPMATSK